MATWHHDAAIKIDGRDRRRADARGGRPPARARREGARGRRPGAGRCSTRRRRCATRRGRCEARLAAADVARGRAPRSPRTRCATSSRRASGCRCGSTASGRCTAPGTSSSRARRAPSPTARRACCGPGTFRTAMERLPAVAAMGFDVVYLPPIHPIGTINRKGPNNTLTPGPDDVGSPWAIGSAEGGHDAIHPDLGTIEDFDAFVAARPRARPGGRARLRAAGAPDHPWVNEHPEWFTTSPTARSPTPRTRRRSTRTSTRSTSTTTRTASTPSACGCCGTGWTHGVRIFRVDNPHTKPVSFWEWLLAEVRETDPDVLFLAEAFTRPAMMQTLARVGFHQSYTYFTWRNEKWELEEYLTELSQETAHYMRPNFFVNTPDILHAYLQYGGPPAFKIRAVLAATLVADLGRLLRLRAVRARRRAAGQRGVPRLREVPAAPARLGRRPRPRAAPSRRTSRALNQIRRAHPALQQLRNLRFHRDRQRPDHLPSPRRERDEPATRCSSSSTSTRTRSARRRCTSTCRRSGWTGTTSFDVHDELTGATYQWGEHNYVRLDPFIEPAHVSGRARSRSEVGDAMSASLRRDPDARGRAIDNFADLPDEQRDPHWFKRAVFYEVLVAVVPGQQRRRHRRPAGPDRQARLPRSGSASTASGCRRSSPRRCATAATTSATTPTCCPSSAPRRLRGVRRRRARARHPGDHRLRHEPHLRPAPVVPGVPHRPRRPVRRLLRLGRHRRGLPRRADHLRRHRDVQLDLRPGAQAVLLAPLLQPPARPQLREPAACRRRSSTRCGSGSTSASTASGSTPCPTCSRRRAPTARTSRATHEFLKRVRKEVDAHYPDRVLLCEANQWPADVVEYFGDRTATSATWPSTSR